MIRKTVVFAILGVFIALVYVVLVAGIGILVGSRYNTAASAIAAAVVALAFQPVRRWADNEETLRAVAAMAAAAAARTKRLACLHWEITMPSIANCAINLAL